MLCFDHGLLDIGWKIWFGKIDEFLQDSGSVRLIPMH